MDAGFNLMCCKKCRGLFIFQDMFLNHSKECEGDPNKSPSQFFACEREIFLQSYERLSAKFFGSLECSSVFHTTGHFLSPADSSQQLDQCSSVSENTSQSDVSELPNHGPDSADDFRHYRNDVDDESNKPKKKGSNILKLSAIKTEIKQEHSEFDNMNYRVELADEVKSEGECLDQTRRKKEKPVPVKLIPNVVSSKSSNKDIPVDTWSNATEESDNSNADMSVCQSGTVSEGSGENIGKLFSVLKKTGKPIFQCNECKYKTRRLILMKKHQRAHATGNPMKCDICTFSTFVKTNFAKHLKMHAPMEVKCNVCGTAVVDKYTLVRHKKLEHEQDQPKQKRERRSKVAEKNELGIMYINIESEGDSTIYNCKLCDYISIEESDMKKHVVAHKSVKVSLSQLEERSHQGSNTSTQNSDDSEEEDVDEEMEAEEREMGSNNRDKMDSSNATEMDTAMDTSFEKGNDEMDNLYSDMNQNNDPPVGDLNLLHSDQEQTRSEEKKAVQGLYDEKQLDLGGQQETNVSSVGFVIERVESLSESNKSDNDTKSLDLEPNLWDRMDTGNKDSVLTDLGQVGSFLDNVDDSLGELVSKKTDFSNLGFEDTLKQLQMAVSQTPESVNVPVTAEYAKTDAESSLRITSVFSGLTNFSATSISRKEDDAKSSSSADTITYEVLLNPDNEEHPQATLVSSSSSPSRTGTTPNVMGQPSSVPIQSNILANDAKQRTKTDDDCCIIGSSELSAASSTANTDASRLCSTFKQDGKEFYQCHLCQFKTAQWPVMRRHLSAHDTGKMLKCQLCDFSTFVQSSFNSHVKKHENPPVKCDICGASVPDKNALKKHMLSNHANQSIQPASTSFLTQPIPGNLGQVNTAKKQSSDDIIVLNGESGSDPIYQCSFCQFKSDQLSVVRKHILTHESGAVLRCNYCSFTTFLKSSMTLHVKKHLSPDKSSGATNLPGQVAAFSPRNPNMGSPQNFSPGMMRSPRNVTPRMTRSPRNVNPAMMRSPRNVSPRMTRSPRNVTPGMRSPRITNPGSIRSPRPGQMIVPQNVRPGQMIVARSPRNISPGRIMTNPGSIRSPRNVNPGQIMTSPGSIRAPRNVSPGRMMTNPGSIRSPRNVSPGRIMTSPGSIRAQRNVSPRQNSVSQYMMQTGMRQRSPQTVRSSFSGNRRVQQFNLSQPSPVRQTTNIQNQLALVPRGGQQFSPRARGFATQSPRMQNPGMTSPRQRLPLNQQMAVAARRNLQQNFQNIPINIRPTLALPSSAGAIVIEDDQSEAGNLSNASLPAGAPNDVDIVQTPGGQVWKCKMCTFNTASKKEIASHIASHNLTPQYKCPHCNHTSLNKTAMETHIKRHTMTPLPCDICGALLSDKYTLQRHKVSHMQKPEDDVEEATNDITEVQSQLTEVRTQVTEVRTQIKQEFIQKQVKREPLNFKQEP